MKVLVIDDESDICDIISFYVEEYFNEEINFSQASGAPEAIEKIKHTQFDLILCDHSMPTGNGNLVQQYLLENRLDVKYVVCSSFEPRDHPELYNLEHVYFNILKPNIENGIIKLSSLLDLQKGNDTTTQDYVPIGISLLYLIREMPSDIYISISSQKYLKCFHKGESFTDDDKQKYQNKEIYFLFAKIEGDNKLFFKIINRTINQILTSKNITIENKLLETHSQVSEIMKSYGFTPDSIELAKVTINETAKILTKGDDEISKAWLRMTLFGSYPSKLFVLQSTLSSIIGKKIKWSTESTLQKIVMATFFQDLNLDSLELIKLVDYHDFLNKKHLFNLKECENYLSHPIRAKEMISKLKNVTGDVDKIVLEQHELPHGDGFPRKLNSHQISPLSALLILTGVISKTILNVPKENFNAESFFAELEERGYNKGNFKEIFNHTSTFFLENK